MDEMKVILEFKRRRKEYLRKTMPGMLLAAFGVILCVYTAGDGEGVVTGNLSIFICGMASAFAGGFWSLFLAYKIYRCPVCNAIPVTESSGLDSGNAINIFPSTCSKCGVRLK